MTLLADQPVDVRVTSVQLLEELIGVYSARGSNTWQVMSSNTTKIE